MIGLVIFVGSSLAAAWAAHNKSSPPTKMNGPADGVAPIGKVTGFNPLTDPAFLAKMAAQRARYAKFAADANLANTPQPPPPPPAQAIPSVLFAGQRLNRGDGLLSPNGNVCVFLDKNGTLAVYSALPNDTEAMPRIRPGAQLTRMFEKVSFQFGVQPVDVTMQDDGNLIASALGRAGVSVIAWTTLSGGHGGSAPYLAIQDDGNLVIYTGDGSVLWASGSDFADLDRNRASTLLWSDVQDAFKGLQSNFGTILKITETIAAA